MLLVAFSAVSGEFGEDLGAKFMDWHRLSGYAILTLLIFTAGCIAVDLLALSGYLAQYPRLRSAVRASYGIRVAISVMLPTP